MVGRSSGSTKDTSGEATNPSAELLHRNPSTREAEAPSQPPSHVSPTPTPPDSVSAPPVASTSPQRDANPAPPNSSNPGAVLAPPVGKSYLQVLPARSAAGQSLRKQPSSTPTQSRCAAISSPASGAKLLADRIPPSTKPSTGTLEEQVAALSSEPRQASEARPKMVDDEAIPEPPKQTDGSGFDISHYIFKQCYVDMDDLIDPLFVSREISYDHSKDLMRRLRESGFNPAMGTISVVVAPKKNGDVGTEWLDDKLNVTCRSFITDGRHRRFVLRQLRDEDPEKWDSLYKRTPASAILRKDGDHISMMEILGLSAYLNKHSATVLATSFVDYVHAAISTVRLLATLMQKHIKGLTITQVTDELKLARTLGGLEDRQLRRYGTVAHRLAQSDDFYKVFKTACTGVGIGIVHVNCRGLLSIEKLEAFQLAFACLRSILINGLRCSFEILHAPFYACIAKLFDQIEKTATHRGMSLQELLDSELYITAHDPKTLFEYVADMMGRYNLVENQEAADKTRLTNLRKKLVALFGDDIEPSSQATESAPAKEKAVSSKGTKSRASSLRGSSSAPRRSGRKRRAVSRQVETKTPPQKRKKKILPRKAPAHSSAALSRDSVSAFLRNLAPGQISSLLRGAGLKVVCLKSPETSDDDMPDEQVISRSKQGMIVRSMFDVFDDNIPNTLPEKWSDPKPYDGPEQPMWVRHGTKIPSKWPKDNPIMHVGPLLHSIHVPHQHRAHSVITDLETLRRNHHLVYWRAAHVFYKNIPIEEVPEFVDKYGHLVDSEKVWAAALEEDDVALEFFAQRREQVFQKGFCILENFLQDDLVPSKLGSVTVPKIETERTFFKALADEARESFPGESSMKNVVARDVWNFIQNVSANADAAAASKGEGLVRMTNQGIVARLESDPEKLWAVTGRALVDIRIAQSLAALKLSDNVRQAGSAMFMPNTGGRWILSTANCERQSLHTCFKHLNRHQTLLLNQSPGYFTIATGENEVPFWVCADSHRSLATASSVNIKAVSEASVVHMVRIPPFSIFVGRGDMHHAAAAVSDGIGTPMLFYQTLFLPLGAEIPTTIVRLSKFKPRFKVFIDDDTEDEESSFEEGEQSEEAVKGTKGGVKQPQPNKDRSGDEYESDAVRAVQGDSRESDSENNSSSSFDSELDNADEEEVDYEEFL